MIKLINRSAHDTGLDAESVHTVITSPPYFGLRKYEGEQDVDWPAVSYAPLPGLPCTVDVPAMRCPLGLEADPYHYVGHLVLVMREMHRVLRGDGTLWLNLGDSFNGSGGAGGDYNTGGIKEGQPKYPGRSIGSLKPKDMIQIPEMVSLALKADGWWVRSRLPWIKRNGMPGSQTDRPTTSHESIFVLTKSARYFWDQDAIRKPLKASSVERLSQDLDNQTGTTRANAGMKTNGNFNAVGDVEGGRYRRTTDWWFESLDEQIAHLMDLRENGGPMIDETGMVVALQINTKGYSKAHFATWPPELVRPMIRASTSARGVCPECGAPWARVVERNFSGTYNRREAQQQRIRANTMTGGVEKVTLGQTEYTTTTTTGWAATCAHGDLAPIPATVLDPFSGSGTTGQVSLEEARAYIGVDISAEYLEELAPQRLTTQIGLGL